MKKILAAVIVTVFLLSFGSVAFCYTANTPCPGIDTGGCNYSVSQVIDGTAIEYRFYCNGHHFLTIINDSGTFNIRPHPGVDTNGWGSSCYLQPFLPGATLGHTIIESIKTLFNKITVAASGHVSRGDSSTYGTWKIHMQFRYDQTAKRVNGWGYYQIALDNSLSNETGDLNLLKMATNYLDDVPLLTGGIGDTGDMQYADVDGNGFNFEWIPPEQPSHFPNDPTNFLSINVKGQLNNVDTAAQGYEPIAPAYKPSLRVILVSRQSATPMIFGGMYDTAKSQMFWEDNVGITPLVLKSSKAKSFNFRVALGSTPLPNDGLDADFDGYNYLVDCNDDDIHINPGAGEACFDAMDNDCDALVDSADPDCH